MLVAAMVKQAMIREHPTVGNTEDFIDWVNTVLKARHGQMMPLEGCQIFHSLWTTKELEKVKRMNDNLNPRRPEEPVIVLRGLKYDYLLDGNRRINTWIKEDSQDLHEVILVCPVYTKDTVEHVRS